MEILLMVALVIIIMGLDYISASDQGRSFR